MQCSLSLTRFDSGHSSANLNFSWLCSPYGLSAQWLMSCIWDSQL